MDTYNNGSKILNQLGLTEFDMGYAVIATGVLLLLLVVVLILLIVQIVKTGRLKKRLDGFLVGKDGASLEQNIINLFEDNKFLKSSADSNKKDIRILYKKMESAYQKMGLVKYDAFREMSGTLSYSFALLDNNDNGVVISSMYSREGCYSYAKEVIHGESAINLSEEEKDALKKAINVDKIIE